MKNRLAPPSAHDLRRAVRHHQAGQFARAEALYLDVLRGQPANPEILNQLGVLYCQRGEMETGLEYLARGTDGRPFTVALR
jgi:Flp pilus assembly protein TadD